MYQVSPINWMNYAFFFLYFLFNMKIMYNFNVLVFKKKSMKKLYDK